MKASPVVVVTGAAVTTASGLTTSAVDLSAALAEITAGPAHHS